MTVCLSYSLSLCLLCLCSGLLSAAEYYRWVDQNGVVHFTDNMHNIPEKQRGTADRIQAKESPKAAEPANRGAVTKASVPFEKRGQVVVIEAMLNGKTPAKLVVDTGATYTMISAATAKELDIDPSGSERRLPIQTANGMIQAPLTSLESINVGGLEMKNLTAVIHDVVANSQLAGLLGLNFLSNFRMDIDTQKGLLHLEKK
ncbi:MAG: TIGR02281 family clan AA aspartic protease [Deltaproteobacteria bacterium]|nr:TIGR02281 family clan AA aspartic protease [Deltaproteobacteria bacterium]